MRSPGAGSNRSQPLICCEKLRTLGDRLTVRQLRRDPGAAPVAAASRRAAPLLFQGTFLESQAVETRCLVASPTPAKVSET